VPEIPTRCVRAQWSVLGVSACLAVITSRYRSIVVISFMIGPTWHTLLATHSCSFLPRPVLFLDKSSVMDGRHMAEHNSKRLRKRRRAPDSGQPEFQGDNQGRPKRQKVSEARPPPRFWDHLSAIPLTSSALQELDRRTHEASAGLHKPTQRPSRDERRSAAERPLLLTPAILRLVKRFASDGRPDLSDLRGVCDRLFSSKRLLTLDSTAEQVQVPPQI
jgi:hypothetical protein